MKLPEANRRYTRSSSFKLALFFTLLLGTSVAILAYFLDQFNESNFTRELEGSLNANIASFRDWGMLAPDSLSAAEVLAIMRTNHPGSWYVYYDSYNKILYQDIVFPEKKITTLVEGIIVVDLEPTAFLVGSENDETRTVAAKVYTFVDGAKLVVARDVTRALQTRKVMRMLGLVTIALMLAVIGTSFFISTYVVSLINRIARTSWGIMVTGDLSKRIDLKTKWDDLANLADILNHMLARIEELLADVRRVSDNIAHDLRTPLSRLRNHLELLKSKAEKAGDIELTDSSQDLISEADHILDTFKALLRIANIESGKRHSEFSMTDVTEMFVDVVDFYVPLAEETGIQIVTQLEQVQMYCDRDLLFQVGANLLDNAIKFSPANSRIDLQLRKVGNSVEISVADQGAGIPSDEKDKVFNRFYRSEECRNSPGSGLGLSLVLAIVELHRGTIELTDVNPGLKVKISLPNHR